ncbi:ORF-93 [Catopsilia pomona nucleopolyhedrovirus]|uniref:ORF-93 n=1 Tax=Catopsilia pomona nucleopolyhedrovirus TaxID=1850906 RepID=A0A172WZG4_9ABAC|nr:ORF-93 [Catopsilia pomona nucleopolyhedrovirus]ANF29741.1 ORF-93 [Catopsilia pomona nucleopolyhedrovirus]
MPLPQLPYEMVIAVLAYMSPMEILNLNLPTAYIKSILCANSTTRQQLMCADNKSFDDKKYVKEQCVYNKIYIDNMFFIKKPIHVVDSNCTKIITKYVQITFDGQYVAIYDILLCFTKCFKYIEYIVYNKMQLTTQYNLLKIYCPAFLKEHNTCYCAITIDDINCDNGNTKFVKIDNILLYISHKYTFGKNASVDNNISNVCNQLGAISGNCNLYSKLYSVK